MARYSHAVWDPSPNFTANGMTSYQHVVLHIEEGSEAGTDSWFRNPNSQVSAHFSVGKDGSVHQHVDTKDKAWAEVAGNSTCISIEHEGHHGDSLTPAQLHASAGIIAWAHATHGIPLVISDDPAKPGLIGHGEGGDAWGGHYDCPGSPILAQRAQLLQVAGGSVSPSKPPPSNSTQGNTPAWYTRLLRAQNPLIQGADVRHVQQVVGAHVDGQYGPVTAQHVKGWQANHGLTADGIVGPETARKMG